MTDRTRKRRRMTAGKARKLVKSILLGMLRYVLLICLAYLILAPILSNIKTAVTPPPDLGLKSSVWIWNRCSLQDVRP